MDIYDFYFIKYLIAMLLYLIFRSTGSAAAAASDIAAPSWGPSQLHAGPRPGPKSAAGVDIRLCRTLCKYYANIVLNLNIFNFMQTLCKVYAKYYAGYNAKCNRLSKKNQGWEAIPFFFGSLECS
jgi:hypothetical protein